jgi:hypothetical protein
VILHPPVFCHGTKKSDWTNKVLLALILLQRFMTLHTTSGYLLHDSKIKHMYAKQTIKQKYGEKARGDTKHSPARTIVALFFVTCLPRCPLDLVVLWTSLT